MINDVMGADYGDEYGEEKPAFKKEEEAEIDFMWRTITQSLWFTLHITIQFWGNFSIWVNTFS